MKLLDWTPDDVAGSSLLVPALQPQAPLGTVDPTVGQQETSALDDVWAATKASFVRDTWTVYGLHQLGIEPENADQLSRERTENWNPYSYIKSNWTKERIEETRDWIDGGLFDDAMTPYEVERRLAVLGEEKRLDRESGRSLLGAIAGNIGGAFLDPLTYIGLGPIMKLKAGARIVGLAGHAAATTAASEGLLHAQQDLRTIRESLMAVGTASIIGGGVGGLSVAFSRAHPLNPGHASNPLREENLGKDGVVVAVPGEGADEISHIKGGDLSSAASADSWATAPRMEGGTKIGNLLRYVTPAGRALQRQSVTARNVLVRMMDLGGVMHDTARFGDAMVHSAEDIKRDYTTLASGIDQFADLKLMELRKDLGDLDMPRIAAPDFTETTRLILKGLWTEDDAAKLAKTYGDKGAARVVQKSTELAERIHQTNDIFEQKLVERGFVQDTAKLQRAVTKLKALSEAHEANVQKLTDEIAAVRAEAKKAPKDAAQHAQGDAELTVAGLQTQLEELRVKNQQERAPFERIRDEEKAKPTPMGRDYGHAQLWDVAGITEKWEAFEDFLFNVMAREPDQEWLVTEKGMTLADYKRLASEKPEEADAILREWTGDESYFEVARAERAVATASREAKVAKTYLKDTLRRLGMSRDAVAKAKVSEGRALRDQFHTAAAAERAKRDQLAAERDALQAALDAGIARQNARAGQFIDNAPDVGAKELSAAERAEQKLVERFQSNKPYDREAVEKLTKAFDATQAAAKQDPLTAPKAPTDEPTLDVAATEARLAEINRRLARADRRVETAELRTKRFEEALTDAQAKRYNLETQRDHLKKTRAELNARLKELGKDVRGAERALDRARKLTPLEDTVRDIRQTLMDRRALPVSIMDRVVPESGRMKARRIKLTPDQERAAVDAGFLRKDLMGILQLQYHQLGGHLGLREALDIGNGGRFSSWEDVTKAVRDDYEQLMVGKDAKAQAALQKELASALKDMNAVKARLIGMEDPGIERDSWMYWGSQKMRQANYIRYGSGFGLTSLTDVAAVSMRLKVIPTLLKHLPEIITTMKLSGKQDIRTFVNATELGQVSVSLARQQHFDQELLTHGIGPRNTLKHSVTSKVDVAAKKLTDVSSTLSFLPVMNRFWKTTAGVAGMHKMREMLPRYASLTDLQKADLASLGIGSREAERLVHFLTKYGTENENGLWSPNLEDWIDEAGGVQASRDFRIALQRDITRSVITPGVGDTPLFFDKWWGRLFGQFQTFGYTFMNRFGTPLAQRVVHYRDMRALAVMATLAWTSAVVMVGKDIINGRDPAERWKSENLAKTSFEMVNRSGLLAYMSPYVDSALKSAGVTASDKYARNSGRESLLGVNAMLLRDLDRAVTGITSDGFHRGDWGSAGRKLAALAPFQTHTRLFGSLLTD